MEIEQVAIESLRLDPRNARTHSAGSIEVIANSLRRFGQQKPIVVLPDGTVIAGNGTLEAAKLLGWTEIAIMRTTLEGAAARAFAIADNRTSELSDWDSELLASVASYLAETEGIEKTLDLGFSRRDYDDLIKATMVDHRPIEELAAAEYIEEEDTFVIAALDVKPEHAEQVSEILRAASRAAGIKPVVKAR